MYIHMQKLSLVFGFSLTEMRIRKQLRERESSGFETFYKLLILSGDKRNEPLTDL